MLCDTNLILNALKAEKNTMKSVSQEVRNG